MILRGDDLQVEGVQQVLIGRSNRASEGDKTRKKNCTSTFLNRFQAPLGGAVFFSHRHMFHVFVARRKEDETRMD